MKIKKQMQKGLSLAIYRFTERERQQIADRERERGEFSFGCCFYTSEMVCGGGIW